MIEVRQTAIFSKWFARLRDGRAKAHIVRRIERVQTGNFGDIKPTQSHVSEMRIDYGPGYRLYFTRRGNTVVILLAGGDKKSQERDIKTAMKLEKELD